MIVDAHMHLWDKLHGMIGNELPLVGLSNGMIRIGENAMLGMPAYMSDCAARAEYAVAEFDAAGVDVGVVVQEYMDGEQNDYLLDVLERFPDRFFMHGLPDFWNKAETVRETRALFERGFRGIKLPAGHLENKIELDDASFMPIWEQMEAESRVLAVDLSEGEGQVPAMENVLARYPKLRVAIGHFAMATRGGWPGQLRLARHENVYVEMGGTIWLYRDEGYPFPGAIDAIGRAKREVGVEKLMWGSDWPRTMVDFTYRQSLDFVRLDSGLTGEEKNLLLGANAARLYNLPEPDIPRNPAPLVTEG